MTMKKALARACTLIDSASATVAGSILLCALFFFLAAIASAFLLAVIIAVVTHRWGFSDLLLSSSMGRALIATTCYALILPIDVRFQAFARKADFIYQRGVGLPAFLLTVALVIWLASVPWYERGSYGAIACALFAFLGGWLGLWFLNNALQQAYDAKLSDALFDQSLVLDQISAIRYSISSYSEVRKRLLKSLKDCDEGSEGARLRSWVRDVATRDTDEAIDVMDIVERVRIDVADFLRAIFLNRPTGTYPVPLNNPMKLDRGRSADKRFSCESYFLFVLEEALKTHLCEINSS